MAALAPDNARSLIGHRQSAIPAPLSISLRHLRQRQSYADAGAGVDLAIDRNRAAVQFHRFLHDCQAESGALAIADVGGAMEALEQACLVFKRYTYALVAHLDCGLAIALGQQQR